MSTFCKWTATSLLTYNESIACGWPRVQVFHNTQSCPFLLSDRRRIGAKGRDSRTHPPRQRENKSPLRWIATDPRSDHTAGQGRAYEQERQEWIGGQVGPCHRQCCKRSSLFFLQPLCTHKTLLQASSPGRQETSKSSC